MDDTNMCKVKDDFLPAYVGSGDEWQVLSCPTGLVRTVILHYSHTTDIA